MCMLGIAAYWLEMLAISSESNDHGPPYSDSVSVNPNVPPSGREVALDARPAVVVARLVEQARRHQREQGEPDDGQRRS